MAGSMASLKKTGSKSNSRFRSLILYCSLLPITASSAVDIHVNCEAKYQQMTGIGAHLYNWSGYTRDYYQTDQFVDDYLTDLGNSMVRCELHPNFCIDSMTSLAAMENYENFSMNLDKDGVDAVFTALKNLLERDPDLKVIGTVWSPPGWMKTNGKQCCGGRLKPEFRPYFARYLYQYYRFLQERYGITLYAMSPQNELLFSQSYNSCVYSGDEYHAVVKEIGSYLESRNCSVKIFGSEDMTHFTGRVVDYISRIEEDPESRDYFDIAATHGYSDGVISSGGTPEENMELYTRLKDYGLEFWMTETSGEGHQWEDGLSFNSNGTPAEGALNGLGAKMHTALVYGHVSGWTYWAYSDPKSYSRYSFGRGPEDKKYRVHKHYSKFIRPGAYRVAASPDGEEDVWVSAYHHEGLEKLTVVLLNVGTVARDVSVRVAYGLSVSAFEAYRTSETENFQQLTNIGVNSSKRTASFTMPPRSMMTLVGDAKKENQGTPPEPPNITFSAPATSSNTAIPVTLTIDRDFGYYSLDGGESFTRFDMHYDKGTATLPITETTTLHFYAAEGDISTPVYTENITVALEQGVVYQQGSDGTVEIEAEGYFSKENGTGEFADHSWELRTGPLSSLGMQALPDNDVMDAGDAGPVLHYKINFSKTGRHYLWTRGSGPRLTAGGNHWHNSTIYFGLNGNYQGHQKHKYQLDKNGIPNENTLPYDYMTWNKDAITIEETGEHSIDIWMRADGVRFDKFVVTSDSTYRPPTWEKPADKPGNLRVVASNLDSIALAWDPGERAYAYDLYYRKEGDDWSRKRARECEGTYAVFRKYDGEPFLAEGVYHFRVNSIHPQGHSDFTDSLTVSMSPAGYGGYLGFEKADMKSYPIPSDGGFINGGYKWSYAGCSAELSSLGSTVGIFDCACVMYGDASSVKSSPIPGGIGSLSFTIGRHGYPSGGQFVIKANGTEIARTHQLDWSTYDVFRYDFPGINIEGDVELEILNITPKDGNNSRGSIDDFAWTAYEGGNVPEAPEGIVAQANERGVEITWNPVPGAIKYRIFRLGDYPEHIYQVGAPQSEMSFFDVSAKSGMNAYRVTALNDNGESGFSDSASATVMNGLRAWYFSDTDLKGYRFDRIDPNVDLSWTSSDGDSVFESDGFSARWEGHLKTVKKGVYLFTLSVSGGVRFWIDDSLLIDSWDTQGEVELADSIALNNTVPVRIEYTTTAPQPHIQLTWKNHPDWGGNWSEPEIVPQDSLVASPGGYEVVAEQFVRRSPAAIRKLSVTTGIHKLTLGIPSEQHYRFRIYNAAGRALLTGKGKRGGIRIIPLDRLPSGLYIVHVATEKEAVTHSFFRFR